MKKFLLRVLLILVPFLWWVYVSAQPMKVKDCSTTCFSSEVVSVRQLSETCAVYELKVSFSGECAHALSHFSVAIPCGKVEDIWNSEGWKHEIGTDPATGMRGFKIDDISNFGEGSLSSFTVMFTLCSTGEDCETQLGCWQPQVAYKASTCVNYETLAVSCTSFKASLGKQDESCFGVQDGSLSVIIEGGQQPYTLLWSDQSTEQTRTNLAAGHYVVTIHDAAGAEVTLEETIVSPEKINVSGTLTAASCNGMADGAVDVTTAGGEAPYTFVWSNGEQTEDLQSLTSGQYTVTVTDAKSCSSTASFSIETTTSIDIAASSSQPDCNDANGSIDVAVTGGSAPYIYQWSNDVVTEDLSGIAAGLYTLTVTDQTGCSQQKSFFIRDNNTLRVLGSSTPTSCSDDASGQIDLTVSGGTSPYTFSWSTGGTSEDITGLTSGYYTVTVTDAKGCTATAGFTVSKKTFQVPRTVVQPTCPGDNNGSITLQEPIGGTAPFTYEWSTGDLGTSLTDLAPGTYSVTVTDATGCSRTITSSIAGPSEISASATVSSSGCNADGSFSIDLDISGGTAPYEVEWSNDQATEDLEGLSKGTYTAVITDAHGCSVSREVIVAGEEPGWSCLITTPADQPVCGTTNNALSTTVADADSYAWAVESTDGSWVITAGSDTPTVAFSAGAETTSASFTLTVTKDGCTRTCSYVVSTCVPDDSSEEPGEDPDDEKPGGEEPGEGDHGDGGEQTCEECFGTNASLVHVSGNCRTYELEVSTTGMCRHDLSHWTVAIPCGTISDYSNSEGWKMEYGKDPTTGLYGLKVDDINAFGKEEGSFTIRFTLCESGSCDLSYWNPMVAYKAGQCVGVETIQVEQGDPETARLAVYPNPFSDEVHFEWNATQEIVSLEIFDQYGNNVSHSTRSETDDQGYHIILQSSKLPKGMYYYRMNVDGQIYHGKISKR